MFIIIGGDGKEYGPVSADQVRAWIGAGRADLNTKAKAVGTEEWQPLADFPEFSLDAAPHPAAPPLPVSELATKTSRLGAALLDTLFGCICVMPGAIVLGVRLVMDLARGDIPDDVNYGRFAVLGLGLLTILIIQTWMLSTRGQSLGKRIAGIRIVRYRDDAPVGFLRAVFLRSWLPSLINFIPVIGAIFPLVDIAFIFGPQRRCLHDLIADTKVIVGNKPGAT